MSRSFSVQGHLASLCAALLLLSLGYWAEAASAETLSATCANLQTQIDEAAKSAGADTVVLDGMCKAGTTLPKEGSFTLQGAPGTTSGFDGQGTTGPLLSTPELAGAVTIENMTFEHAKTTSSASGGALEVDVRRLTLRNDEFVDDTDEYSNDASGGGARVVVGPSSGGSCQSGEPPALTVTGSTFLEDRAVTTGTAYSTQGGGLFAAIVCGGRTSIFENDVFEKDHSEAKGSVEPEGLTTGGGLTLLSLTTEPGRTVPVQQRSNVFDSNIVSGPAGRNDGGGGEWLAGMSLTSVGDRFSRNSITGTTGSAWSWGGGLGILGTECNENPTENTLEDAVVAANSIGVGTAADLGGGGIYLGCEGINTKSSNHLRLLDSTVTENTVATAGGVAGIDGGPEDQLSLENSIVANDVGGSETGGFGGPGGSLTAKFSDFCAPGSSTMPLSGEGNICANPMLADNGKPESVDVHETSSSLTIDRGSNALVPNGLTTDFYGGPRTLAGHAVCSGEVPKVVDMGATEFAPAALPCPPPLHPPVPGLTKFIKLKTSKHAVAVTLGCTGASTQICSGVLVLNDARSLSKQKVIGVTSSRQEIKPVKLGETTFSLAAGRTATFTVKLDSTGISLLHRLHSLSTIVLGSEAMPNNSVFLFLFHAALFTEHKHKAHKHKAHKHKKRHHKKKRHHSKKRH
ncbi:MAG: hypothetical protein ACRDK2_06680 [Solirubrobacteraceae bacterium]